MCRMASRRAEHLRRSCRYRTWLIPGVGKGTRKVSRPVRQSLKSIFQRKMDILCSASPTEDYRPKRSLATPTVGVTISGGSRWWRAVKTPAMISEQFDPGSRSERGTVRVPHAHQSMAKLEEKLGTWNKATLKAATWSAP